MRIARVVALLVTLAHGAAGQVDPKIVTGREAARETATELLEATVSGIWVVRDAAVHVLSTTPDDAPCRKDWRRLAARATEALWPYVTDWSTATAETTIAAVSERLAAAVADKTAAEAMKAESFRAEMEDLLPGRKSLLPSVEKQLAAVEDRETTALAFDLAEKLSSGIGSPFSETVGCVERGGLTWEEWVEAEAAGKAPATPPANQDEAARTIRQQSGVIA